MTVYKSLESTPEENAKLLEVLEKKFITDRTPAKFKARVITLAGTLDKGATELETEVQTLGRWCNGKSKIPGVAWVALAWWEERENENS